MANFVRVALLIVAAGLACTGRAQAAPTSPSVVGEPPLVGVFRFPQAVAVTPGGSTVVVGDEYSGVVQAFDPAGAPKLPLGQRATRGEPGRLGVLGGVATDRSGHVYALDAENKRVQI